VSKSDVHGFRRIDKTLPQTCRSQKGYSGKTGFGRQTPEADSSGFVGVGSLHQQMADYL
jgi:hypothetical protein